MRRILVVFVWFNHVSVFVGFHLISLCSLESFSMCFSHFYVSVMRLLVRICLWSFLLVDLVGCSVTHCFYMLIWCLLVFLCFFNSDFVNFRISGRDFVLFRSLFCFYLCFSSFPFWHGGFWCFLVFFGLVMVFRGHNFWTLTIFGLDCLNTDEWINRTHEILTKTTNQLLNKWLMENQEKDESNCNSEYMLNCSPEKQAKSSRWEWESMREIIETQKRQITS